MYKSIVSTLLLSALALSLQAQEYEITAPKAFERIHSEHLQMGGSAPDGGSIEVNNFYMLRDSRPVIPVMGEFHYTRYPADQWEEEIIKMKVGGIQVIPTYIFWSLHEENEGEWNWSGSRDLRRFCELCQKHGMEVIVRIGPFGHGEIRSGGLPDWLFTKNVDVRSDDPTYLHYVAILYQHIAEQIKGLYYKDGGPIIGCQIENEHQHSAAPWALCYPGEKGDMTASSYDKGITKIGVSVQEAAISKAQKGDEHMETLLRMAHEAGIETPFYTATGWGNAAVIPGKALPVTSGYTYPTWVAKEEMSPFCMFKDLWHSPDYSPVRYTPEDYPSASAEMGVGIQMVYDKRPTCTAEAAEALMIRSLGGGSNIIGYYMYHGGSTPQMQGNGGFFSDQPMGVPKISYDFQAPLGEFGLEAPSYRPLRVIHNFLDNFADRLAPMQPVMPDNAKSMTPSNRDDLRYAARIGENGEGFLFLVNSQDHDLGRHDQSDLTIKVNLPQETIRVPATGGFTLPKGISMILPFNFPMEGALLKYATAQPLMKIDDGSVAHYFFWAPWGMEPEYVFDPETVRGRSTFTKIVQGTPSTFKIKTREGKTVKITTLTRSQALDAVKVGGRLLITDATVVPEDGRVKLTSLGTNEFEYILYPSGAGFAPQRAKVEKVEPKLSVDRSVPWRMEVRFTEDASKERQVNEYFLKVAYTGDVAFAFLDNKLVLDHFWQGRPWNIGLNRFSDKLQKGLPLGFYFRPLRSDAPFLGDIATDSVPDFSGGPVLEIAAPEIVPEYCMWLDISKNT